MNLTFRMLVNTHFQKYKHSQKYKFLKSYLYDMESRQKTSVVEIQKETVCKVRQ